MNIENYFDEHFPGQLRKLHFRRPNRIVSEEIMEEPNVVFFGGMDWKNCEQDLKKIKSKDKEYFILCLFLITLADQCIHAYYREHYPKWKRLTGFPKFGWSGFGPHFENPLKLLWVPEEKALVNIDKLVDVMPEFIAFMYATMEDYFSKHFPAISPEKFVDQIRNDESMQFDKGRAVKVFKQQI